LFVEEQRLWPEMDELLGYPTEFRRGRIRVALDEDQLALYGRAIANAARQGFAAEALDRAQLRELVPLVGDNAVGGYLMHFGGHANPQRTVQAYAWALQDHGGRVLQHTEVTGFTVANGRVASVATSAGVFGCDHLVIAAGPQTGRLAAMLGVDGNGLYGRQTLRGNLVYGGGPHEWLEPDGTATPPSTATPLLRNIAGRLAELFPRAAHARLLRSW